MNGKPSKEVKLKKLKVNTRQPNAIIIVPNRETTLQVADVIRRLLAGTKLRVVAIYANPT